MVVRKTGQGFDHYPFPVWYYPNAAMMNMKYRYNKQKMPSIPKNSEIAFMVRIVWCFIPSPLMSETNMSLNPCSRPYPYNRDFLRGVHFCNILQMNFPHMFYLHKYQGTGMIQGTTLTGTQAL